MKHESTIDLKYGSHGSLKSYIIGFLLSIFLTLVSYFIVEDKLFAGHITHYLIAGLAFIQAIIQMVFFLHLGEEQKPYWNFIVFSFMVLVLLIIILGSLWIMFDLDYRLMNPMDMHHD